MSLIGKKIEEFDVPAYYDGDIIRVSNKDLEGKWSVFFFYPGDFTFVCPTELEDLALSYDKFKAISCEIYSVSTDSEFVHKAWWDASETIRKIQYPMISDRAFALSEQFGVLIEGEGQALRGTFVVNPQGEIVLYEVNSNGIGRNAKELLRKVQAAQFVFKHGDKVCPARWEPGDETLTPGLDLVGKI
jgi:peroxiredoxin